MAGVDQTKFIELARQAGVRSVLLLQEFGTEGALTDAELKELEAVRRLFNLAYDAGAAAEREACLNEIKPNATPMEIAAAIRARSVK